LVIRHKVKKKHLSVVKVVGFGDPKNQRGVKLPFPALCDGGKKGGVYPFFWKGKGKVGE